MKLFISLTFFYFFTIITKAQNLEVHYNAKSIRQMPLTDGKVKVIILDYEVIVYQSDSNIISFIKPQYLLDYPSGQIITQNGEASYSILKLDMDTIQKVNLYRNKNKQFWYYDNESSQYFTNNYKLGTTKWKLFPETKEINGLNCKHAITYNGGDTTKIFHDIWYYPNIAMGYGLFNLKDAPGLVVECNNPILNLTYTLKYFKKDEPINSTIFWPAEFNKVKFEDYTKPKVVSEKDKKKTEIMGQQ